MASHLLSDPEHWRKRAKVMRSLAASLTDAVSIKLLMKIAADYELLAKRAENRIAHKLVGDCPRGVSAQER